jgi:hypothetical protein
MSDHTSTVEVEDDLRAWAKGMYTLEAAVELLIRGMEGRFARPGNPWIKHETGVRGSLTPRYWADLDVIGDHIGALSSGEQAFLKVVASLGSDDVDVNLSDAISRLDRPTLDLVLAGLAHAAGSHQHSGLVYDDAGAVTGFEQLGSLYPWPA